MLAGHHLHEGQWWSLSGKETQPAEPVFSKYEHQQSITEERSKQYPIKHCKMLEFVKLLFAEKSH